MRTRAPRSCGGSSTRSCRRAESWRGRAERPKPLVGQVRKGLIGQAPQPFASHDFLERTMDRVRRARGVKDSPCLCDEVALEIERRALDHWGIRYHAP